MYKVYIRKLYTYIYLHLKCFLLNNFLLYDIGGFERLLYMITMAEHRERERSTYILHTVCFYRLNVCVPRKLIC